MSEHARVDEAEGSDLDSVAPVALIRFRVDDEGRARLTGANTLATRLLGRPVDELRDLGFHDGLFEDDGTLLDAAVAATGSEPGPTTVLRWGGTPPVTILGVRLQRGPGDGSPTTLLAAVTDLSDQYRLDTILCGDGSGVFITDLERNVAWMSPMTEAVLGIPPESFVGTDVAALVHPDDQPALLQTTEEMGANPGLEITRSYRMRHPLIDDTWWRMRTTSAWLPDDPVIGGVATRLQLTVEAEADDPGAHPPMTLAEMTPSGLLMAAGGRLTFRNNLARQMLGAAAELDDELAWVDVLRPTHRQAVRDVLRAAQDGRRESATVALDRPGAATLWLRIEGAPASNAKGHVVGYIATLLDVTTETETREQLQRAQAQLWQLANHDQLTGLANRMQFSERLEQALARLRRDSRPVAVLYCDLDRFKPVNDRLGHAVGDEVLVAVAHRLSAGTRQTDTVCRFGGDEFLIVCEGFTDPDAIRALAERLVAAVAEPVLVDSTSIHVGLSIGMALADPLSTEVGLLTRSDAALYRAKQVGRGQVVVAD
jgi:diguanylate cyclase (GGDEF)-like protein